MSSFRVDTLETGKRAKPLRTCAGCGCGIRGIRRCGPCADIKRETDAKRRHQERKAFSAASINDQPSRRGAGNFVES